MAVFITATIILSIYFDNFFYDYSIRYYINCFSNYNIKVISSFENTDRILKNFSSDIANYSELSDSDIINRLSFYKDILQGKTSAIGYYRKKDNYLLVSPKNNLNYSNLLRLLNSATIESSSLSFPLKLSENKTLIYILEQVKNKKNELEGYLIAQIFSDNIPIEFQNKIKKEQIPGISCKNHLFIIITDKNGKIKFSNNNNFIIQNSIVSLSNNKKYLSILNSSKNAKLRIIAKEEKNIFSKPHIFYLVSDYYFFSHFNHYILIRVIFISSILIFLLLSSTFLYFYSYFKAKQLNKEKEMRSEVEALSIRLLESEKKYRTLIEASPLAIYVIQDNKLKYINPAFIKMFSAYTNEELLEFNIFDVIHPDDRKIVFEGLSKRQKGEETFRHYRFRLCPTKDIIIICDTVSIHFSFNGEDAVLGFMRDVTKEEEMDSKLKEMNERLIILNRRLEKNINQKDEFLSNLSHELRTPIVPIKGYLDILKHGGFGVITKEQLQIIEVMEKSVSRLLDIVNNLLTMTSLIFNDDSLIFSELDLSELIKGAIAKKSKIIKEKEIEVSFSSDEKYIISGDKYKLENAILCIIDNAIKFGRKKGHVSVKIVNFDENNVKIIFIDDGEGIEEKDLPYIFEDFYMSDSSSTRKHGGLGIGLSIANKIFTMHGGKLNAHSNSDKGTVIEAFLPKKGLKVDKQ